jgi:hypothetical protein
MERVADAEQRDLDVSDPQQSSPGSHKTALRSVEGEIRLQRVRRLAFPVAELIANGTAIAELGRDGSLRIFFGPGRRVRLADGTEWRIKAITQGPHITPIVVSPAGTVAISGPLFAKRSYGINVKDRAYSLIPLGKTGLRRQRRWLLRRYEDEVAAVDDTSRTIITSEPIPTAAILLVFTLLTHGIPGEGNLMPKRD